MTLKAERIGMLMVVVCSLALGGVAGEPKSPSLDGALSERGLTVDPTTVKAYNTPRL